MQVETQQRLDRELLSEHPGAPWQDAGEGMRWGILNRGVGPAETVRLFKGKWRNRIPQAALLAVGLFLLGMNLYGGWQATKLYGWRAPRSPLYGIWNVEQLSVDGHEKPPLITDDSRWRRVIFQSPTGVAIQPMTGTNLYYRAALNMDQKTIVLTKNSDPNRKAEMSFEHPQADQLSLEGDMDGHRIRALLVLFDESKFLLRNRGFHWVQELPFNR